MDLYLDVLFVHVRSASCPINGSVPWCLACPCQIGKLSKRWIGTLMSCLCLPGRQALQISIYLYPDVSFVHVRSASSPIYWSVPWYKLSRSVYICTLMSRLSMSDRQALQYIDLYPDILFDTFCVSDRMYPDVLFVLVRSASSPTYGSVPWCLVCPCQIGKLSNIRIGTLMSCLSLSDRQALQDMDRYPAVLFVQGRGDRKLSTVWTGSAGVLTKFMLTLPL